MAKTLKKWSICMSCAMICFWILGLPVKAAPLLSLQIEQVTALWPEVSIWLHVSDEEDEYIDSNGWKEENIQVRVDGEILQVEQIHRASDVPTHYYYLVDVSTSMTRQALENTKNAILTHWGNLRSDEEIVVISFGESIQVVCDTNDSLEEAEKKLEALAPIEEATRLFDGISKVVDVVSSRPNALQERNVAILVSDGIDYTQMGMTRQEVIDKLQSQGLLLCGIGMDFANNAQELENMGELTRASGGFVLYTQEEQLAETAGQLIDRLTRSICIRASGDNNRIGNAEKTVSVTIEGEEQALESSQTFMVTHWLEDMEAPTMEIWKQGDNSITLRFSEPVLGAEQQEHYHVFGKEEDFGIREIEYDAAEQTVTLFFEEILYNGEYTLQVHNITDASAEENPVRATELSFVVTDSPPPVVLPAEKTWSQWVQENIAFCFGMIGCLFLTGGLVGTILYRTNRKKRVQKEQEIMRSVDQAVAASANAMNAAEKAMAAPGEERRGLYETCMMQMVLSHQDHPNQIKYISVELKPEEPYYIGRSQKECDLTIDDVQLSRKHMMLCWNVDSQGKRIILTDLHSTNGTWLNGIRVRDPRALHYGDVITAGEIKLIVYFEQ